MILQSIQIVQGQCTSGLFGFLWHKKALGYDFHLLTYK